MEIIFEESFQNEKIEEPNWIVESDREGYIGVRHYTELLAVMAGKRLLRNSKLILVCVHCILQSETEYQTLDVIELEKQEDIQISVD
jgi:hypothetical protein